MSSHFVASPCLIVLAHNEAKIVSLASRLPLGGFSCRTAAYGSFGSLLLAKQGGEGRSPFLIF